MRLQRVEHDILPDGQAALTQNWQPMFVGGYLSAIFGNERFDHSLKSLTDGGMPNNWILSLSCITVW